MGNYDAKDERTHWVVVASVSQKGEVMDWRPIETAPKDGTWVLLRGGQIDRASEWKIMYQVELPPMVVGQCSNPESAIWHFAWYDGGYLGEYEKPTHWMPLPHHRERMNDVVATDQPERF